MQRLSNFGPLKQKPTEWTLLRQWQLGIRLAEADTDKWFISNDGDDSDKLKIASDGGIASETRFTIQQDGNVGIGTASPQRALHISDVMRLEPRSSAPSSASQGDIYMHDGTGTPNYPVLRVHDGTQWNELW